MTACMHACNFSYTLHACIILMFLHVDGNLRALNIREVWPYKSITESTQDYIARCTNCLKITVFPFMNFNIHSTLLK